MRVSALAEPDPPRNLGIGDSKANRPYEVVSRTSASFVQLRTRRRVIGLIYL
jgi:hypothetical protein